LEILAEQSSATQSGRSKLSATLVTDDGRFPLEIASDSTQGFLSTGALMLNLDNVATPPGKLTRFALEFVLRRVRAAPHACFASSERHSDSRRAALFHASRHDANGSPDLTFRLTKQG